MRTRSIAVPSRRSPQRRHATGAAWLGTAAALLLALPAPAQVVGYEISVAQVEAGRIRHLAQRLAKQNLLHRLHLGGVRKADLVQTANRIDRVIDILEQGSPSYAVPKPWNEAIREQIRKIDQTWSPLRSIAVASSFDYLRVTRQYVSQEGLSGDPLVLRYFDSLAESLVEESEKLMALYDAECKDSGVSPVLCVTASTSGFAAMLSELATKQAIYIAAGIDADKNRKGLEKTIEIYAGTRRAVTEGPFFKAALSSDRGRPAEAAIGLLESLRHDWDEMQKELTILRAGDEKNFDLDRLLALHSHMVERIERFTGAMVHYAYVAYGT